jgi:glutamate synthase (NADPH/NADH) large chain
MTERVNGTNEGQRGIAMQSAVEFTFANTADPGVPPAQGLYDPALDKDSCGVGFIADIKGRKTTELGFKLPAPGEYAVGYLFMPHDKEWRQIIKDIYAELIAREGLSLLGWRNVPTDNSTLGESVKPTEPWHMQVFIGRGRKKLSADEFERRLYILRKAISNGATPAITRCRSPVAR